MRKLIILILVFALLLSAVGEAQMGVGRGRMGRAFSMMDEGRNIRAMRNMHGMGFYNSGGNAYGQYVTFTVDRGEVLDYGILGNPLFNISIENFDYRSTDTFGSMTLVANSDNSILIQLHDHPAAVINILTRKSISITFTLAEEVSATKEDGYIKIESGNITGYILGTGNASTSIAGNRIRVDAPADSNVIFRAPPVNMPSFGFMHQPYNRELARRGMGMDIAFGSNRSYSFVNYTGMELMIQAMEQNRIRMLISSAEPGGKFISINLDNSTLMVRERERLRVYLDGSPMQCASAPDVVLNSTAQNQCWISPVQDGRRAQMMLYIASFSVRTVDILVEPEVTPAPTSTPAPGFELMATLAGLLMLAFISKHKRKK